VLLHLDSLLRTVVDTTYWLMVVGYSRSGNRTSGSNKFVGIQLDSLITAAARALAAGDPLGALNRVALRDDAPALALRGIAMAQLGDLDRAKALLRRAARAFGPKQAVARARCVVAEAEIALVSRELGWPAKALDSAWATLETHGDRVNASYARYLEARRLLLIGRLDDAEQLLGGLDPVPLPPAARAAHELVVAGIAMRRLRTKPAREALVRAGRAAGRAGIPALTAEVENAARVLNTPAACLIACGEERLLLLEEVEALLTSKALVVDATRHVVRHGNNVVRLASRPVLFALARALGEAWPGDVSRAALVARAFRAKHADESHRARLRVEVGRLRSVLRALAGVSATKRGFALVPRHTREVVVLARPVEEGHAAVLALLADGESWSSSALALALGASQRSVQRALNALAEAGKVQSYGRGRARRWMTPPVPGFTTTLLLPAPLPID
jgi:DNA-binding transcriptional ArsR family regulator